MDDRGQILLLSALAVSVCLIMLAMYLTSIKDASTVEKPWAGQEALENVIWAEEKGLEHVARMAGNYTWDRRQDLENDFKKGADRLISGISRNMLARGIAISYEYNETLASEYAAGNSEATEDGCGGIIVKKIGNDARVCACAYDVSMTDGSARYTLSRVIYWG
jgi:hypothetical protein